jgi:hypothetical protein
MPFGLKNAPTVFSRITVQEFQVYIYIYIYIYNYIYIYIYYIYIYIIMVVYFDDWMIYNLFKNHIQWLRLMLEQFSQIQLSLNIKKFIFSTPIGILLGHVVCKDGVKVNMEKIKIILDLKSSVNLKKKIKIFPGHTGYYRKFICHYSNITFPMDELLHK